jgi:hypothetical protein
MLLVVVQVLADFLQYNATTLCQPCPLDFILLLFLRTKTHFGEAVTVWRSMYGRTLSWVDRRGSVWFLGSQL